MRLRHLWLSDFRNFASAELAPASGLTAVVGANGQGKTNLLEAVGYLANLSSFRGAPGEALVRAGTDHAVVRAEIDLEVPGRTSAATVEAELRPSGRDRVLVNRQPLRRVSELAGTVRVTVFSPDDLALVKGGPSQRRRWVDDLVVARSPRLGAVRGDLDRVLRQRSTLLRQAGGRLGPDIASTLDVWDAKLADLGERLADARGEAVDSLGPLVAACYDQLADRASRVGIGYRPGWRDQGLAAALAAARGDDVRRAATTVGPHRDDVELEVAGMAARTHASQGEQRSLALALRLAGHRLVEAAAGSAPVVLLDDVFSELDAARSAALVRLLPVAQALLTTTGELPAGTTAERVVRVAGGRLVER
ncbi:MAG TPA: DNA replication/repair protein RecF [Acidimicrobiales bacterium]|nr:DNA replication/repair protein RecF [Acidimicrobiales bacterium]